MADFTKGITIQNALKFPAVNGAYQDSKGNDICGSCRSHYVVGIEELQEIQKTVNDMYEALKALMERQEMEDGRVVVRACPSTEAVAQGFKALAKAEGK